MANANRRHSTVYHSNHVEEDNAQIADGARSPELMHFFDSALVDMMQRREDLFFARMMAAFKTEMQVQVKSSYSKAAEAARRAEFAEKEVERLEARLSRRTRDWEVERADYYRQILALRELLRRHGISEGDELRALAVTSAGTAGSDDPMGSTVRRALEAQVRSLESDLSKAQATVAELQARVSKAVAEDRDTRQRLAQSEEQLAIASRRSRDLTCVAAHAWTVPRTDPHLRFACVSVACVLQRRSGSSS